MPLERRRARYRCALVFSGGPGDPAPLIAEGVWEGFILDAPRGAGGFGYDPYFWLPELGLTAAELEPEEKNRLSHRGTALRALRDAARERGCDSSAVERRTLPLSLVRAHALVRAQMPVLRLQFAPAEVRRPDRRLHRCADPRLRVRSCRMSAGRTIEAVFFGGGTPSLFPPEDFARLLDAFAARGSHLPPMPRSRSRPIPGTIERGRFSGYRDAGINRVSLGAQSFAPRALARLGRIHWAEDTHRAVAELRAASSTNFNLDLMYALPEQTLEEALEDVRIACALEPCTHLLLSAHARARHGVSCRPPPLPDEDAACASKPRARGSWPRAATSNTRSRPTRGTARAAGTI